MSRFLYKYMPLRDDFFGNPMIRATPAIALNDPFEGIFNIDQVRDADRNQAEYYRNNGHETSESNEHAIRDLMGNIQADLSDLGILSFTEDHNNPLMWAHYADEHRGMVIEFDFTQPFFMDSIKELDGRRSRFGKGYLGEVYEFPEKVDYRFEFPNFSRSESSAPDSMYEYHWSKFHRAILFTKANEWIYEKEQRAVVRLCDADAIICDDNEHVRKLCILHPSIVLNEEKEIAGRKRIRITYPNEYEMHEDMADESIKSEIYHLTSNLREPAIHLFRINPKAISAVYFGCKSNHQMALKRIRDNPSLSKMGRIYEMRVNPSHYRLDIFDVVAHR